jgi:peptide chain release factor 1
MGYYYMLELIKDFEQRLNEINDLLTSREVLLDQSRLKELSRERRHVEEVIGAGKKYRDCINGISEAKEIIADSDDSDLIEMAKEELEQNSQRLPQLEQELTLLMMPRDPNDDKNAIIEIRAGTGGAEAAIFAADLYRMYTKFAEKKGWKTETLSSNAIEIGGVKEVIFMVKGEGAYGRLKFESGVHRVQRVPQTESQGRIHTSAATVAVLLEAEDIDLEINEQDLKIDVYRSTGPGGQSVNTTDSAVRITYLPTGMVVTCQDEKSQHKNKAKAMRVLKARLLDLKKAEQDAEIAEQRRSMVSTGDRSAKIRTYNFPQSRVTDHRIKLTVHNLTEILDGELDNVIDALKKHDQENGLKAMNNSD